MRKGLFWLNNKQWTQIRPHLPTNQTGPARDDDRRIISGIIHMYLPETSWLPSTSPPSSPIGLIESGP